jgi:hypothetical protein
MRDLYRNVSEKCNEYGTIYKCSIFLEEELNILLADPAAYRLVEGKCAFGTTSFFSKHRWHLSWQDNDDLLDCIHGSCHIPLYCRRVDKIRGIEIVDGAYGFAGRDLPHGDETLYVGIDPHAEITRQFTNAEMIFPSVGEAFDRMVCSGYEAFTQWDGSMNAKVGRRLPNYQALVVLWVLKALELVYHYCKQILVFRPFSGSARREASPTPS